MAARPALHVADRGVASIVFGSALEWVRLFVGARSDRRASRAHPWLFAGWVVLITVTVSIAGAMLGSPDAAPRLASEELVATETQTASPTAGTKTPTDEPSPLHIDLAPLTRSTLFRSPVVRPQPKPSAVVPDLANELQLNGVIGGDNPQAIIFHKRTQQIHSVRVGQRFGEFEVVEIRPMRVVLKWRDETFELSI